MSVWEETLEELKEEELKEKVEKQNQDTIEVKIHGLEGKQNEIGESFFEEEKEELDKETIEKAKQVYPEKYVVVMC